MKIKKKLNKNWKKESRVPHHCTTKYKMEFFYEEHTNKYLICVIIIGSTANYLFQLIHREQRRIY